MTFPVEFNVFGMHLHPHPVMEVLAYSGGAQLYFFLRRRSRRLQPAVPLEANLWILVGCVFGALFGAKLLAIAEGWGEYSRQIAAGNWPALLGGKTIIGGLLGGWAGVEIAKRAVGVRRSTGDLFVFPLIVGIAVGRIGCFLTGLADHTHGVATSLPWGVDFGDGVRRHPTQLYEIGWLVLLGVVLARIHRSSRATPALAPSSGTPGEGCGGGLPARSAENATTTSLQEPLASPSPEVPAEGTGSGRLFRAFLLGYLGFRFAIEFIKPSAKPLLGLSAIQMACGLGVLACAWQLWGRKGLQFQA